MARRISSSQTFVSVAGPVPSNIRSGLTRCRVVRTWHGEKVNLKDCSHVGVVLGMCALGLCQSYVFQFPHLSVITDLLLPFICVSSKESLDNVLHV